MTWTSSLGRDRVLGITGDDIERIVAFDEGPDSTVSVVSVDDGSRLLVIDEAPGQHSGRFCEFPNPLDPDVGLLCRKLVSDLDVFDFHFWLFSGSASG